MSDKRDNKPKLTFAEKLRAKSHAGFDDTFRSYNKLEEKKEARRNLKMPEKKDKHGPKTAYSKLPVSILTDKIKYSCVKKTYQSRDPRFDKESGTFNEGLFAKSYSFIEDVKRERFTELK